MKTVGFLVVIFSIISFSQTSNPIEDGDSSHSIYENTGYPMHSIDLRITYWNNSKSGTSIRVPGVEIENGGMSGKIMYNYYYDQNYAITFGVGVMEVQVEAWALHEYTSTVAPVMMGMKYYFNPSSKVVLFRPYVAGSIGILIGSESSVRFMSVREHNESAIGGYAGIGSDIILGSLVKLHADIGYNLFTDFPEEIGYRKNYSGAEFSMGLGFMF